MSPVVLFIIGLIIFLAVMILGTAYLMGRLNHKISQQIFSRVEGVIIAGILIGTIGMFQPFTYEFYTVGFLVLLISTLVYIVWSHIVPRGSEEEIIEGDMTFSVNNLAPVDSEITPPAL